MGGDHALRHSSPQLRQQCCAVICLFTLVHFNYHINDAYLAINEYLAATWRCSPVPSQADAIQLDDFVEASRNGALALRDADLHRMLGPLLPSSPAPPTTSAPAVTDAPPAAAAQEDGEAPQAAAAADGAEAPAAGDGDVNAGSAEASTAGSSGPLPPAPQASTVQSAVQLAKQIHEVCWGGHIWGYAVGTVTT